MLPLALIAYAFPPDWLDLLEGHCRMLINPPGMEGLGPGLMEHLREAEGILSILTLRVDEVLLAKAPRLKVISNMAVGVDNIDLAACTRRGIPVGNTPGVLTDATADLTMALLLSIARQLPRSSADARDGLWQTWSPTGWLGADLSGATLGIIGMGKIGRAVARRAKGFGLNLIYADSSACPDLDPALQARFLPFDEVLRQSDFVSVHVPLSAETRGMIGERELRLMKPTAYLVNAARGPIVDTEALLRALQEGWIAGAALDVTDPEPLPSQHTLYSLPNCLIVPHIGSATYGTRKKMAELACLNLIAGLEGQRLPHCANPEVYG